MSIDVTYYSFNPNRSDKKLQSPEGQERLFNALVKSEKDNLNWQEREALKEQVDSQISKELEELTKTIKIRLQNTSLDYDWEGISEIHEFLTEEEKTAYLSYTKKYEEIEMGLIRRAKPETGLKKFTDKESALEWIRQIDLELGAIQNLCREDGIMSENKWLENPCISSLLRAFDIGKELPSKEELILIYQNLNVEKFQIAASGLAKEADLHVREANVVLKHFLEEIKPVVLDLSQNQDSLFYVDYGGSIDSFPDSVDKLLDNRAELIFKKFHEQNRL